MGATASTAVSELTSPKYHKDKTLGYLSKYDLHAMEQEAELQRKSAEFAKRDLFRSMPLHIKALGGGGSGRLKSGGGSSPGGGSGRLSNGKSKAFRFTSGGLGGDACLHQTDVMMTVDVLTYMAESGINDLTDSQGALEVAMRDVPDQVCWFPWFLVRLFSFFFVRSFRSFVCVSVCSFVCSSPRPAMGVAIGPTTR